MKEPTLKQIHYDKFIVEFVEKDSRTYIHFHGAKEEEIDNTIKKTFFYPIKETGRLIEELLTEFAPEVKYLDYSKKTLEQSRDNRGELIDMSEEEISVMKKNEELQSMYEERGVIHKSITFNLLSGRLEKKVYSYILPEVNPFIDELMLKLAEDLDKLL